MSLALIAEVLAGETLITPGGAVDAVTTRAHEPFLWERWMHDVEGVLELSARPAAGGVGAAEVEAEVFAE
jgi:hypothetical protein